MLFSLLFTQPFCFRIDYNGNAATLLVFSVTTIAPYIEYIKFRVENFHLPVISKGFELIFCDSEI